MPSPCNAPPAAAPQKLGSKIAAASAKESAKERATERAISTRAKTRATIRRRFMMANVTRSDGGMKDESRARLRRANQAFASSALTRSSIASIAAFAAASLCGSRERTTTLVLAALFSSMNG